MSNSIQNRIVHDEELIVRLQRGDEWAFQLLIRRFRNRLFSVAFGITLDTEESRAIVRDVFSGVYHGILDFRGDASLATWLYRATVNRSLSWKRRWSRRFQWFNRPGRHQKSNSEASPGPEIQGIDGQTRQRIDQALKKLSDQARTVFILRELEDLSYADIAYVTGTKPETIRSRLFHARRLLRAVLETATEEDTAQ